MATMYLCKLDPDQLVRGAPKFVALVGRIVEIMPQVGGTPGYRFLPNGSAHQRSTKIWADRNACIPRYTKSLGFLRLFDAAEYAALTDRPAHRLLDVATQ